MPTGHQTAAPIAEEPAPVPFSLRYVPPSLSTFFALCSAAAASGSATPAARAREKVIEAVDGSAPFEDSSDDNNAGEIGEKVGPLQRVISTGPRFRIPPLVDVIHGIVRLQLAMPGRSLGYKGKLAFVRRSYTRLRSYCKNEELMSVLAIYATLGGTSAGAMRFQEIKEYVVYEGGILVGNAFARNQEEIMRFLCLFDN